METPDALATPKDIELTTVTKTPSTKKKQGRNVEMSFCTHVGFDGAFVMFFLLAVAGLFVYITFLYTKSFRAWHREWVWLFLLFAVLYSFLAVLYIFSWKQLVKNLFARLKSRNNLIKVKKGGVSIAKVIMRLRTDFRINGTLYLWKLYFFEFLESVNQLVNLNTVYLCTLPVEMTTSICFLLAFDSVYRAYQMNQPYSVERRNRQIKIDIAVDFLCVAVPLLVLWFVYSIPISISEMLQITLLPSFFIISKLRSILREIIRVRVDYDFVRKGSMIFTKEAENQKRITRTNSQSARLSKKQEMQMPRRVTTAFSIYSLVYGLFLLSVAVAHLAMRPSGCDTITWEKGCVNKIPFCKSLFTPTCNCASLEIKNDYKLVALPSSLVDTMTGLRKVFVRNCNLTALPPRMEQLTEMVDFEVSFSQLQSFHVDVGKWEKLNKLHLQYNNITQYNENALWTHSNVAAIFLLGNKIRQIPFFASYLPSLNYLHIGENNIDIEVPLSKKQFPSLVFLYVNGNNLIEFPDESLGASLVKLGVARCNLKTLPQYLSNFNSLKYLDARGNNITFVDNALKVLMKTNKVESYFAGNDVCKRDKSLDCEPLCSKYCWSRDVLNDGICDETCNTKICQFDGGDCMN